MAELTVLVGNVRSTSRFDVAIEWTPKRLVSLFVFVRVDVDQLLDTSKHTWSLPMIYNSSTGVVNVDLK